MIKLRRTLTSAWSQGFPVSGCTAFCWMHWLCRHWGPPQVLGKQWTGLEGRRCPWPSLGIGLSVVPDSPGSERVLMLASQRSSLCIRNKGIHLVFICSQIIILPEHLSSASRWGTVSNRSGSWAWRLWAYISVRATDNSQGDEAYFRKWLEWRRKGNVMG